MNNVKLSGKVAVALVLLPASAICRAEPYVGGSVLFSEYKYDDVGHGIGGQGFAGYVFDRVPFMIEVTALDSGNAKIKSIPGLSLNFQGFNASVGYFLPARGGRVAGSGTDIKVGFYSGDSKISAGGASLSESSSGASVGIGGRWMLTRSIGLHFDFENYFGVKDVPVLDPGHKSNLTLISAGLVFDFPSASTRAAEPAATSMESSAGSAAAGTPAAPANAGTAQSAETAPAASSAPPAAEQREMPAEITFGAPRSAAGSAPQPLVTSGPSAKAGAQLRTRPMPSGDVIMTFAEPRNIQLMSDAKNLSGNWWYVKVGNVVGWLQDADITH